MIVDECTGRASRHFCTEGTVAFTANMNVDYKAPVLTPGVVTVWSWIEEESKGRKQWVGCRMEQVQEGRPVVVAEGRCLFLEVPKPASYASSML